MNREERAKLIVAMEYITRHINDEDVFMSWLMCGVPDGDIEYGSFDTSKVDEYFLQDDHFKEVIALFMRLMNSAYESGGLYCDKICSGEKEEQ